MKVVLALGGNALQLPDGPDGIEGQQYAAERTAAQLLRLVTDKSISLAITHGNGPQWVQNFCVMTGQGRGHSFPLRCVGCNHRGLYWDVLQNAFHNAVALAKEKRSFVSLVTQVVVDEDDPAFNNPSSL